MCYTCSSTCDNCRPKLLQCPACGAVNLLSYEHCQACGTVLDEGEKRRAKELWDTGVRFGKKIRPDVKPMSRTNSPFARVERG